MAANDETAIVTSEDISELADGLFSADSDPRQTIQWLQAGGFEKRPPAGYGWVESRTDGSDWDGEFTITGNAAETGGLGMRITAATDATYGVEVRVDIDKGQEYRFGAVLRGTAVGSVTLSLQPVEFGPGGVVPVGREFVSPALTGSFDWTPVEGVCALTTNHDFVLLSVRVEGGGTADVDNVFVQSTESRTFAFPAAVSSEVLLGTLIHIEDVPELTWDSAYFRAKKQVLEDLAALYNRHGAVLTIQPEMELLAGLSELDPDFIRRLRTDYGCRFSVHTHGPKGPNPTIEDVLAYVAERKEKLEAMGAGSILDLNGNFDVPDYSVFSEIGIFSMTAFKNTRTQTGYEGRYFHPWRPSPGNPYIDEAAWAVDNPESQVAYIPGDCTGLTRYSDFVAMKMLPGLTAALWNTDPEKTTTWYFITHVDFFASRDGATVEEYMQSNAYREDLGAYEDLLFDVLDPLVERGFIRWAGPNEMSRVSPRRVDEYHTEAMAW